MAPEPNHPDSFDTKTILPIASEVDQASLASPLEPSGATSRRLMALFEVAICSGFPTQILLAQILSMVGIQIFESNGSLSLIYVATLSLADSVVLIALIIYFLRIHQEHPKFFFLGNRKILGESALGLFLVPGIILSVLAIFMLLQQFAPWLHNVQENPLESLIRSPRDAWVFGLVAVIAGGIREEIQRAFMLRRFEQLIGNRIIGLFIWSILFGAGHVIQGWDAVIITTMLGAFWGGLYLIRRNIVSSIVSHSGFNIVEILRHLVNL